MDELREEPYTEWLEEVVRNIFERNPTSMALVATLANGDTLTAYYNADAQDMAVFAHHIQADIILEVIRANTEEVKKILEEEPE